MQTTTKIQLVMINENTLGYILPEMNDSFFVLRAIKTKGSEFENHDNYKIVNNTVRLANENDFNNCRVEFNGYRNDSEYLYGDK